MSSFDKVSTPLVPDLHSSIIGAWRTNCRVTEFLVASLPADLWDAAIPGITPRRTVRTIVAHLHNVRSRWIKTLGQEHGITAPAFVDLHRATPKQVLAALKPSARGIEAILVLGLEAGGTVPPSKAYVWRNLPLDVGRVLTYFVAHEAHHRGQIVVVGRALGFRLPREVTDGLWQWNKRSAEAGVARVEPRNASLKDARVRQ